MQACAQLPWTSEKLDCATLGAIATKGAKELVTIEKATNKAGEDLSFIGLDMVNTFNATDH